MGDREFLLEFAGANISAFRAGEIPFRSLVSRLEGVVDEAERRRIDGFEALVDSWEWLETCNAVMLDRLERLGWIGLWSWRAKRALARFERVAHRVLGPSSESTP